MSISENVVHRFACLADWRAFPAPYPCRKLHGNWWCHELGIPLKWKSERWLFRHDPTHLYTKIPHLLIYLLVVLHIPWWFGECVFLFACLKILDFKANKKWIAIITILSHLFLKKIYGIIGLGLVSNYGDSGEHLFLQISSVVSLRFFWI